MLQNWWKILLNFLPPLPPKKTYILVKNKTNSKLFQIAWNGEYIFHKKIVFVCHWNNLSKSTKKYGVKSEKNQSCSKLPEMPKKLVKLDFWIFGPPYQKIWGPNQKNWGQKGKISKLFQIAWNGEKVGQQWFSIFFNQPCPPPFFGSRGQLVQGFKWFNDLISASA